MASASHIQVNMKIENQGKEFVIIYDSAEFTIPEGEMEIADAGFATFIVNKARKWGIKVIKISNTPKVAVAPIAKAKKEVKEEKKEVKKEEKKETKTKK